MSLLYFTETTDGIEYSNGNFVNHRSSTTLVVKSASASHSLPLLCWIFLSILVLSIVASIIIICCVCFKNKKSYTSDKSKGESYIATHINGFSPTIKTLSTHQTIEMLPKYVATPAQNYSTQKLYQWCQQKELQQHYKSLWSVNPSADQQNSETENCEIPNSYKTRSLPSKNKQRPVSSIEDPDELYSKVNFSKKLRNRMNNNEAAIIAFFRSRSQNLALASGSGSAKEDGLVVYDERTAL